MVNADPNRGQNFTETIHHDTYPFIADARHAGRTVLISGASRGIGKATALSFARSGARNIILAARSNLADLKKEIDTLYGGSDSAPNVIIVELDVTSEESVDAAVKRLKQQHISSIDILVNNAGYLEEMKPLGESDRREWWRTWEVNVKGTYLVVHAMLELVLASELKTIINISSKGGIYTRPGASAYGGSKAALIRFGEFLDFEYREQGLTVYSIHPGSVSTELALRLPAVSHNVLIDTPELAADTLAWLSQETRPWLAGRYVSVNWDMSELLSMQDEIVKADKLKTSILL